MDISGVTQATYRVAGTGSGNHVDLTLPVTSNWKGRNLLGSSGSSPSGVDRVAVSWGVETLHNAGGETEGAFYTPANGLHTIAMYFNARTITLDDIKALWEKATAPNNGGGLAGKAVVTGDGTVSPNMADGQHLTQSTGGSGDASISGGLLTLTAPPEERDPISVTVRASNADGHTDMSFSVRTVSGTVRTGTVAAGQRPPSSTGSIGDWFHDGTEAWRKLDDGVWNSGTTVGAGSGVRIRFSESGNSAGREPQYALINSNNPSALPATMFNPNLNNGNLVSGSITMRVGFGFTNYGSNPNWGAAEHPGGVQIRIKDGSGNYGASQLDFTPEWEENLRYVARHTVNNTDELYIGRVTGADVAGSTPASDMQSPYAFRFPSTNTDALDWFTNATGGAVHSSEILEVAFVDSRVRGDGIGITSGWIPSSLVGTDAATWWPSYSQDTLPTLSAPSVSLPEAGQALRVSAPTLAPNAASWEYQYRAAGGTWLDANIAAGSTPSTDITGLTNGTEYEVRVRQLPFAGATWNTRSAWSTVARGTPLPPALATPNLQASNIVRGDRRLTINRPTPPDAGTDRWQLVMTHPGGSNNQVVNGTSVTVSGLDPDVDYSISIEWIPQRGYRRSARSASVTTHPYGASLGIPNPSPLTEYNLDNATVQVDLHARTPEYDSAISASDFSLSNAPSGVSISNAARTSDRRATLTFSFGAAADFDADASIGINVAADAYDGGTEALSAGTLSVAATTETAPSFPSSTLQQVQMNYGEAYTRTFDAVDAGHPTPTYSLTFTPSLPSGSPATSVLPTGVSFNSATRVLTFSSTAAPSASGTYTWTAAVRGETSATQTLRADIAGAQAPVPGLAINPRSTSIELSVSISSTNGWRYRYATSSAGLDSATITDVAHGTTTATITGLSAGTTYYVRVQAIGDGGSTLDSVWSAAQNVRTLAAGAAYATLASDRTALREDNLDEAVLTVALTGTSFSAFGDVESNPITDYYAITGLPSGTTVDAYEDAAAGDASATVTLAHDGTDIDSSGSISVVVKAAAHSGNADLAAASITYSATVESRPDVPVDLAVETRDTALSLSWSTVSGADGYQTRYKENSSPDIPASWTEEPLLSGRATTYRITGLANGTAYDVSIRSVKRRSTDPNSDRYGIVTAQSYYSSIVTATPQEITIASMGTTPNPLDEGNLNGASVELESTSADFTEEIGPTDFTVSGVPGVGVASVSRSVVSGKTRATLVLSYDGSDFDAPANMQITTGLAALLPSPGTHKQMSSPIPVQSLPEAVAIALSANTEATLGTSFTLALTLTSETFADPLSLSDFNVTGLPLGTTLDSVVRNSATSATLNASYNGRDFDDNAVVDVDCLATGLSRAGNILASDTQSASTRTITARNETAALSSPSSPVTEENLGTASFVLSLVGEEFSSTISLSDFSLSMSPAVPSLSLRSVARTSTTSATFFLSPPDGGVDLDSARQMRLTALSSGHTGDDDLQSNAVAIGATDEAAPSAPAGMSVLENDGRLEVSWTDPSDAGILKYQYRLRKTSDAAFQESDWTDIAGSSSTTTSHTFTGLDNGDTYQVQTRAIKNFRFPPGTASVAATATPNRPGAELSSLVPSTGTGTVTESDLDGARAVVDLIAARNFVASPTHGMFRLPTWGGNLGARYEGTFVQSGSMLAVVARRPLPSYWFQSAGNRSVDAILIGTTGGGTLELRLGTADSTVGPQLEATVRNALGLKLESGEHSYTKYGFTGSEPYTEIDSSLADFFSHVSAGDAVTVTIWDGSALTVEDSSGVVRNSNTRVTLSLAVKDGIDFDFPLHFAVDVLPAAHNGPETLATESRTVAPVVEYATASLSNRTHLDEENLPGAEVVLTLHGDTFDSEAVVENLANHTGIELGGTTLSAAISSRWTGTTAPEHV